MPALDWSKRYQFTESLPALEIRPRKVAFTGYGEKFPPPFTGGMTLSAMTAYKLLPFSGMPLCLICAPPHPKLYFLLQRNASFLCPSGTVVLGTWAGSSSEDQLASMLPRSGTQARPIIYLTQLFQWELISKGDCDAVIRLERWFLGLSLG